MAQELRYIFQIENGVGRIINRNGFDKDVQDIQNGKWILTLKKYQKSRTTAQNSYYHAVVVPSVRDGLIDLGFAKHSLSLETVHEMLKQKFLQEDMANEDGVYISITKSTTELSTTDFMNYIDEIQRWANEFLNIVIPNPGEQSQINY